MEPLPRALSPVERAVIHHLLAGGFTGADAVRRQVEHAVVVNRHCSDCPSVGLAVPHSIPGSDLAAGPLPVEGSIASRREDGPAMDVLIFLDAKGRLCDLERVHYGERHPEWPALHRIEVWSRGGGPNESNREGSL